MMSASSTSTPEDDARVRRQFRFFSITISIMLLATGVAYTLLVIGRVPFDIVLARGLLPALLGALSLSWFSRSGFRETQAGAALEFHSRREIR